MKKSKLGIILMEALLVVALILNSIFGGARDIDSLAEKSLKDGQSISLNKTLAYKEPKGYKSTWLEENRIEAFLLKDDKTSNFSIDMLNKQDASIEQFFNAQEKFLLEIGEYEKILDKTEQKDGANIVKRGYKVKKGALTLSFFVGAIDFSEDSDEYIAIIGSANEIDIIGQINDTKGMEKGTTFEEGEKTFTSIIDSIELTKFTLDKNRTYFYENEGFEVTMPPNWKKLTGLEKYQFYKEDKDNFINLIMMSVDNKDKNADKIFNGLKSNILLDAQGKIKPYGPMYNEKIDGYEHKYGNLLVNGIVFEYEEELNGRKMYTHIAIVKSKSDADRAILISNDAILAGDIEKYMGEVEEIIKSINFM